MPGLHDYSKQDTARALQLLLELVEHLKAYKDHIILVGGWAPYFLIKDAVSKFGQQHIGSLDADLFLDFRSIPETAYETIFEILGRRDTLSAEIGKEKSSQQASKRLCR